jgi:hypothetical protein
MLSFFKHLRVRKLSSFISVLKLVWRSNGATSHKIWGVFEDCRIVFSSVMEHCTWKNYCNPKTHFT